MLSRGGAGQRRPKRRSRRPRSPPFTPPVVSATTRPAATMPNEGRGGRARIATAAACAGLPPAPAIGRSRPTTARRRQPSPPECSPPVTCRSLAGLRLVYSGQLARLEQIRFERKMSKPQLATWRYDPLPPSTFRIVGSPSRGSTLRMQPAIHPHPACGLWSRLSWTLLARLAVILWTLAAHTNN
ncbi:MAG: hypothetical protein QOD29_5983 [Alphaproteobacteria bacterium]|nr:hypothetical protein [Alphaproteobacteria bacterium]